MRLILPGGSAAAATGGGPAASPPSGELTVTYAWNLYGFAVMAVPWVQLAAGLSIVQRHNWCLIPGQEVNLPILVIRDLVRARAVPRWPAPSSGICRFETKGRS